MLQSLASIKRRTHTRIPYSIVHSICHLGVFTITFERKILLPARKPGSSCNIHGTVDKWKSLMHRSCLRSLHLIAVQNFRNLETASREGHDSNSDRIARTLSAFPLQSANHFRQFECFISRRACNSLRIKHHRAHEPRVLEIFIREVTIDPCVSSALKIHSQGE